VFRQPSGSDEGAGAISLQGSQKRLRAGYDPIASGLSRIAVRGRPFLSERTHHNRFCYYKGGLAEGVIRRGGNKMADYAVDNVRPCLI
jgi:hypothetical protein